MKQHAEAVSAEPLTYFTSTGHGSRCGLRFLVRLCAIAIFVHVLTAERVEALGDLLDVIGLDVADVCHEIGDLVERSVHTLATVHSAQEFAHISPAVRDLLINIVLSQNLVH